MNPAIVASLHESLPARTAPVAPSGHHDSHADLIVTGLSKHFANKRSVLNDISFTIPHGQAVALIGHNGSGKSTLLRCCLRLITPSSGSVNMMGKDITSCSASQLRTMRARVGFVFQRHNLVQRLSVLTNVLHGVQSRKRGVRTWFHGLAHQQDRLDAMAQLDQVGLAHLAEQRADSLSGGESQRVAIARALMQHPQIVMADEPVASLDPKAGDEVMRLFISLIKDQGLTFLFVSHNLKHALEYSDRIIGLRDGRLEMDRPAAGETLASLRRLYG
jgi:phosphonate transport system ATP-binding protein